MAVYGTNNQDRAGSLGSNVKARALVWLGHLEAEAEVAGVHQQESKEHTEGLVAQNNA